ncbi:MAG: potassium-transporting ATPase subunit F [Sutterellaceae bacterium]|nr:potassium-transporting ATPase subunit F [Sutterellaceae bacterium]MDD7441903.1 potassium-transporting ATPase subunit F [Sutterellaceae bacterium]MDY2867429.1 potassium-transporting ATPase subunit F [Mesosutterella sp.]
MGGDATWVYWLGGIAAVLALIYLIVVLFNAEYLD